MCVRGINFACFLLTVPTIWYFRTVPTVWYFFFFFISLNQFLQFYTRFLQGNHVFNSTRSSNILLTFLAKDHVSFWYHVAAIVSCQVKVRGDCLFCWYWWNCLNFLSLFTWLGKLQKFFIFDLEKNIVAIAHSCFWLAETLIISSDTKIPNNLLVGTENLDFVWIWQKHN